MRLPLRLLVVAGPALLAGGLGTLHPIFLTPDTADRWQLAHYLLLPVFPLLGASLWVLLRGESGAVAWTARVLAALYAVGYVALDSIAGIGAPELVRASDGGSDPVPLYDAGDPLGQLGVVAFALSAALTAGLLYRRSRSLLAPGGGVLVVVASIFFYRHHVFPPRGVLAMVVIAAGLAALAVAQERAQVRGERSARQ